jgi:hypothetical protein
MKPSLEFFSETLSGIHPDSGHIAADHLVETLQEVYDELSERMGDTKRLLDQIRSEQI